MVRLCLMFLALFALAPEAAAHNKSLSYSDWSEGAGGTVVGRFRVPARQTTLLLGNQPGQDAFAVAVEHVRSHVALSQGGADCPQSGEAQILVGAPDMLVFELAFACPDDAEGALAFRTDAFYGLAAGHLHFVRSTAPGGTAPVTETVLTVSVRETQLFGTGGTGQPRTSDWGLFFVGVNHILMGVDHMVFVLGLLLIAKPGKDLLVAVTGFTIGHSLSMAAAVTGFATADSATVEALIAFTIWLLGVLALKSHMPTATLRPILISSALLGTAFVTSVGLGNGIQPVFWIGLSVLLVSYLALSAREHTAYWPAALFLTASLGLAHGFGFAGGLQEAFSDTDTLLVSLLAFNLGVEAGQLVFIGAALLLALSIRFLFDIRHFTGPSRLGAASFVTLFGAYWFTERAILSGGLS